MSVSADTWRRAVEDAHRGDWRCLLELLLLPLQEDGQGQPVAGADGGPAFNLLPDDLEVRLAVVRALLFGAKGSAVTVQELWTRTGWGKGKPSLSDYEVAAADLGLRLSASAGRPLDAADIAAGLGVEQQTLEKRVQRRRAKSTQLPPDKVRSKR